MKNNTISSAVVAVVADTKTLIAAANKWRRSVIQNLFNACEMKNVGSIVAPSAEIVNLDELSADFLTVGTNPTERAFSNRDIIHFGNELAEERETTRAKLTEVTNLIQLAHGRVNPYFLKDRTHFTAVVAKATAVLSFLSEELDRRESDAKASAAAAAEAKAQQRELDRLEHEAFLQAMRDKYRPRGARVPNHAKHADKLVGKGLESLALIAVNNRKSGKFTTETFVKKAEAIALGADLSKLPAVLPDYRVIDAVKKGACTRYVLKA